MLCPQLTPVGWPSASLKVLRDFVMHPTAVAAELSPAHVMALRLYTTGAFKFLNAPLVRRQRGTTSPPGLCFLACRAVLTDERASRSRPPRLGCERLSF